MKKNVRKKMLALIFVHIMQLVVFNSYLLAELI